MSVGGGRLYALDVLTAAPALDVDDSSELTLSDRSRELRTSGIPAPVTVLTQGEGAESAVFTADGNDDDVEFGDALRPTYWAEQ